MFRLRATFRSLREVDSSVQKMFCAVSLLVLIQATTTSQLGIDINIGGSLDIWGNVQRCPLGTKARGFMIKVTCKLGIEIGKGGTTGKVTTTRTTAKRTTTKETTTIQEVTGVSTDSWEITQEPPIITTEAQEMDMETTPEEDVTTDQDDHLHTTEDAEGSPPPRLRRFIPKVKETLNILECTAVTAIKLLCAYPYSKKVEAEISSTEGKWGQWGSPLWCPGGELGAYTLKLENKQILGGDTVVNNIGFLCTDGSILTGNGGTGGKYVSWSVTCKTGICGIRARRREDGAALTDVKCECC
ncbi:uncharacterized protein [Engystomops pustulosus]|uniref:uncharacterized protein n=1 Tax=Engystomops pustulosus TaxID=76066 RepID=UPI003AFB277C